MAGRIPQPFIDDVVTRSDIVEIIGARVPLKKAGREFKACCPFHNEKSPSFWVSPDKQFYHCFGCGAHGTAIDFVMQHRNLGFTEAVTYLLGESPKAPEPVGVVKVGAQLLATRGPQQQSIVRRHAC